MLVRMRGFVFTCTSQVGEMSARSIFCFGLLLILGVWSEAHPKAVSRRQRRSLAELSTMVNDVTGRKSLDFISYGNWCGLGGSGHPVDPIDECCQIHDLCYNLDNAAACKSLGEKGVYQVEYKWSKADDGTAKCDDDSDKCKLSVCLCDAMLTNCLKSNMEYYNKDNVHKLSLFEMLQEANWLSTK